jgi:hypothetical protein
MARLTRSIAIALMAIGGWMAANRSQANTLFTTQATPASGTFEWDVFSGTYVGPHAPDVAGSSVGATLTGDSFALPGPPQFPSPLLFAGSLYSGGRVGRFHVDLTGASTTGALTTVVLQIAFPATDDPLEAERFVVESTVRLDGNLATEYVDRGTGPDGERYLWAEWRGLAANASYDIDFDANLNHFALDGAKLEYFNGDVLFDAVNAAAIPEPSTIALAVAGLCGLTSIARRKRVG